MARHIRRFGPYVLIVIALIGLAALLLPTPREATATTYEDPWWTNDSSSPACPCACGCNRPPERYMGVSYRNGDLLKDFFLFSSPGMVADTAVSVAWSSDVSGLTQMGRGMVGSWEHTVEYVILNEEFPEAAGGHQVLWRGPDHLIVTYDWDGSDYSTSDCAVHHTLTRDSPYKLTDLQGNEILFDTNGMIDKFTDRNGNVRDYTYDANLKLTGFTDDRGKTWTVHHDGDGFIDYIDDSCSRRFTFDYDQYGNLVEIGYPATTDQPAGTTTTISYDESNRITEIEDGRGNTVFEPVWIGATRQVDKVTIDGDDVDFTYESGRTDVTDRNGNVRRIHYSGQNITQTDMWIDSQAKYVTTYTYSGSVVTTVVYPRLNRIDYIYDGNDNVLERRHKVADVPGDSGTDIVHTWEYTDDFVTSYTDPLGEETTYTRDAYGNVTEIDYPTVMEPEPQEASKTIAYNSYGQITSVTDEEGKVTTRSYFGSGTYFGLLQKIEVDPSGLDLETTFAYDSCGNVTSVTDPRGNATTRTWDALRRLKQETSPSPLSIDKKWEYDANGNVTKFEIENLDKDGDSVTANPWITTTYTYTDLNQLASVTEEIDASTTRTASFDYDDNGNRIRVTKGEGNKDKWTFTERNLVASFIRGETSNDEVTIEYEYDDNGNRTVVEDGRNSDWTTTYDLFDRRTKVTDPLGHYVEYTLDKRGGVTKEERKNSSDTTLARRDFFYDERGRLWKTEDLRKDPGETYGDAVTTFKRKKTGHLAILENARNVSTGFTYDNAWRRTSVTDALGNETTFTLDANGNPTAWEIEEVDGGGTVTHDYEATYDVMNQRVTYVEIDRTDGENELETTYGHDSRGNLVWLVNAKGDPTRFTFDGLGRMIKKQVALTTGQTIEDFTTAIETEWQFDDNDRLTSHKDDTDNETTWDYDALDRPVTMTYPDSSEVTYDYDDNDNVVEVIDPAGNEIDDTYNVNNWRTARSVTLANGFLDTTSESFTYDGLGRMTEASDNDYKVEFTHAVLGLRSMPYEEKQSYVGGSALLKTVTKTYDEVGNVVTELYPSGLDLDRTWNDIRRLSTVTDGTNTIASYSYVGTRVEEVEFQNGTTATTTYTGFRNEVARVHHETSSPATLVDLQYGYDEGHDRLYERYGASGQPGDAYAYDKARRLTTAWMGSATPSDPTSTAYVKKIEYNMDDDGNRTSVVVTPYQESPSSTSYTDNNLNQYTAVGGTSPTYDDNGNLTDDDTYTYEYNYKNLICRVKEGETTIATCKYDALGRRVEKYVDGDTQRYIYSGAETVSVYDGSNDWVRDFVFGQVIDEVLMLQQADVLDFDSDQNTTETTRSFYHRNALGSVMEITDMNEAEVASYRYDPYGAVTITIGGMEQSSDPLGQPWLYTGRFTDEETWLYYYRARYYSSGLGRFLQRDPLGQLPGPNVYQYVSSSPSNKIDPFGLSETTTYRVAGVPGGPVIEVDIVREGCDVKLTGWRLAQLSFAYQMVTGIDNADFKNVKCWAIGSDESCQISECEDAVDAKKEGDVDVPFPEGLRWPGRNDPLFRLRPYEIDLGFDTCTIYLPVATKECPGSKKCVRKKIAVECQFVEDVWLFDFLEELEFMPIGTYSAKKCCCAD